MNKLKTAAARATKRVARGGSKGGAARELLFTCLVNKPITYCPTLYDVGGVNSERDVNNDCDPEIMSISSINGIIMVYDLGKQVCLPNGRIGSLTKMSIRRVHSDDEILTCCPLVLSLYTGMCRAAKIPSRGVAR